ncbi:ADC synthase [Kockovaella imperatae]|uniref:ADC synthase n=1 Tax=Kockovaella imperatae TaxID=4999 RepID=A0A1Y1UP68_9TREE|nr:ADC synthase [Kockovaella imperatae]ORX38915.1 ADC synthase [Kockovaella imperatae]
MSTSHSAAFPSLADVTDLFENGHSAPSTLAAPYMPTYPSTSAASSSSSSSAPQSNGYKANTKPNLVPVFIEMPADMLTPVSAYLKIASESSHSFLLESVIGGENLARYSFVGADPLKVIRTGPGFDLTGDPLKGLEAELEPYRYVKLHQVPTFTGGAVGFITYDAISHFEPVTKPAEALREPIAGLPEAYFMLTSTLVIFDHIYQTVKLVSHVHLPDGSPSTQIPALYEECVARIEGLRRKLENPSIPLPVQKPIQLGNEAVSNVGKSGYEGFVTKLKEHIVKGDIIQAVPSQRLARPTSLHPFNLFRQLRRLNPSPYMFYLNCGDVQVIGASPETLCKVENRKVYNHAIAGTVRRGKTAEGERSLRGVADSTEDAALGLALQASEKDRAEHIMLVDLARNDVNRVCKPETTHVDALMKVEKFSHVIHMTSMISGILRDDQSRFDAFRSIFPAGTVSGAPKIKAIQLISGLEKERRGVYAGAVGRFDFDRNELDTCIAIRTMTYKDGVVYLQAGGGIVFDSNEEEEYIETINKLKANVNCIDEAERYYAASQA